MCLVAARRVGCYVGPKTDGSQSPNRIVSALQTTNSNGFAKDILQFLQISDECITLSACDLQKPLNIYYV